MSDGRDTLRETYDRIAEDWHRDHQSDTWWINGTDTFISLLPPGASVLDAGCGGGTKAKYLARRGLAVTGIDFSERFIAIARHEVPGATFTVMDIRDLSALPGKFDAVFAQAVLLHIAKRDLPAVLRELAGKIRPEGLFYVAVKEAQPGHPEEEMVTENDYGYEYRRFFSYLTLPELETLCQSVGLEPVYASVTPSGRSRWIQIISRKAGGM